MGHLVRLSSRQRVHPKIAGSSRAIMVVEQARAVFSEGSIATDRLIYTFGDRQDRGLPACEIVQVDIFVAIDVSAEGDVLAVGRKLAAAGFPLVFREPLDLFGSERSVHLCFHADPKETNIFVPVLSIRSNQYLIEIFA